MNLNKKVKQIDTEKLLIIILVSIFVFIISTLGWSETDIVLFAIGIIVSGGLIGICGCVLVLIVDGEKE